jgi:hypothetical protein
MTTMESDEELKARMLHSKTARWRIPAIRSLVALIILALLAGGGYIGYAKWQNSKIIIPPKIRSQVTSSIFWPTKDANITGDKTTIKYDTTNKLLSYLAYTADGIKLTVSEQASPAVFSDIPAAYSKFTSDLRPYSSFDTANDKVFLTHPKELNGGQTAVMNTKGVLIFIRPDKSLTDDSWKQLFNNLDIVK